MPGRRNKDYIVIGKNRILEIGSGLTATVGGGDYRGSNTEVVQLTAVAGLDVLNTIQPTPTPTGNTTNLNSTFKDANGDTWIVDANGDAILAASVTPPSTVVIDNALTDPTLITDPGRYIVPATGGTGVFVGHDNEYADFDGTTWTFSVPLTNDRVIITTGVNAGNVYRFTGTVWTPVVPTVNDFWRSGTGGVSLPNGVNDTTENIRRNGSVGLNVDALSTLDVNGTLGLASTNVTALTYTANALDYTILLNNVLSQTLTLPTASTVNRRIYTIVNSTATAKVSSAYFNMQGISTTVIPPFSSVTVQSTLNVWKQIDGYVEQTTGIKELTAPLVITNWASPFTEVPITGLDITVPAGKWLEAKYILRVRTSNGARSIGLKNRGFTAGDFISGQMIFPNYTPPSAVGGNSWYTYLINETNFDTDPGSARGIDSNLFPNTEARVFVNVRYKNNTASAKTFGYDFGADVDVALAGINLTVQSGSSVVYQIL